MVNLCGKFKLIRNENFLEHLITLGIPEELAKKVASAKPTLEISTNGKNISFSSVMPENNYRHSANLVINEEVNELLGEKLLVKSYTTIKNNTITIVSKGENGVSGTRLYEFFDDRLIMNLSSESPGVPVAKRYYDRCNE